MIWSRNHNAFHLIFQFCIVWEDVCDSGFIFFLRFSYRFVRCPLVDHYLIRRCNFFSSHSHSVCVIISTLASRILCRCIIWFNILFWQQRPKLKNECNAINVKWKNRVAIIKKVLEWVNSKWDTQNLRSLEESQQQ